jgi:hypothetical protein
VEHLLKYAGRLPALRETGCAFVTTAVESVDDRVLRILDKGHTCADFIRLAGLMREIIVQQMEQFFFGEGAALPTNFVPQKSTKLGQGTSSGDKPSSSGSMQG